MTYASACCFDAEYAPRRSGKRCFLRELHDRPRPCRIGVHVPDRLCESCIAETAQEPCGSVGRPGRPQRFNQQNFNQAVRIADRGYVIVHGQIAFEGRDTDELNNNELVRKFYLGL